MGQISILSGIYGDAAAQFRISYPRNLEPMVVENGLSKGSLRMAPGLTQVATGPGPDRGAINWNDVCYRVMGDRFISVIAGAVTNIGGVGFGGPVSMAYSFDRLAIASNERLYYWDGAVLAQVTDPDLGAVRDVIWIDGYFMTTDGRYLVVTELSDPAAVDPLKYGSSEADPDQINALRQIRGEVYALNRYTIENFQNVGGNGFPFQRNPGGMIPKGCVGTHATCDFLETFAFVGSARNEAISVYLAGSGQALPISTPEIDRQLASIGAAQQAAIEVEARVEQDEQRLLVHLPDRTLVYNHQATKKNGSPVWHILAGGVMPDERYPARHFALVNGQWIGGGEAGEIGVLDETVETQFGKTAGWRFETALLYNEGRGAIIRSLELAGLTGRAPFGVTPTCFLSISHDGTTYGQERAIAVGQAGNRMQRVQWRPKTKFANFAGLRFRGANTAIASWARLEADIEGLSG